MTDRERGFQQAWSDAMFGNGYKPSHVLRHYSEEYIAGYYAGQRALEAAVDAAAQERIFDPTHD